MPDSPLNAIALPEALNTLLRDLSPFALAFSGGLDSRFLAHAVCLAPADQDRPRIRLLHAEGPHVPASESAAARASAFAMGLAFTAVAVDPLILPEVRANGEDRCYHCKRLLFTALGKESARHGCATLCDGSNASDLTQYRPGLRALRELGVRSPLAECGLDKSGIHRLAAATGMDDPGQRARPCLLTRFAYGLPPSYEALKALELAEGDMAALLALALPDTEIDFRLRLVSQANAGRGRQPYRAELHLSRQPDALTVQKLAKCAKARGFPLSDMLVLGAVSGHYDRAGAHSRPAR